MKKFLRIFWAVLGIGFFLFGIYFFTIAFPSSFFKYKIKYANICLYSDNKIPENAEMLLGEVRSRLEKSTLYRPQDILRIYVCNDPARWNYFANFSRNAGGVNYVCFRGNSFLRKCIMESNRLIGPSGRPVPDERTMVYYMAHEMTHALEGRAVGWIAYLRMPVWVREGYADYVARDGADVNNLFRLYHSCKKELDPALSGLYLRYLMAVGYMLDFRKIGVPGLLRMRIGTVTVLNEISRDFGKGEAVQHGKK